MAAGLRTIKIKFTGDASDLKRVAASAADSVKKVNKTLQGAVGNVGGKVIDAISSAIDSLPPMGKPIAMALGGGLAVFLSPIIGAAISSALLLAVGGGVLAAGIAAVAKTPKVSAAFGKLKSSLFDQDTSEIETKIEAAQERFLKAQALGSKKGMQSAKYDIDKAKAELTEALDFNKVNKSFKDMFEPFVAPLERIAGSLTKAFNNAKPAIERMAAVLAPVLDRMADGALEGFISKALPGIEKAVSASVPLFNTLAEKLPMLGESIGTFFETISSNSDDTTLFFGDLLEAIGMIIIALGKVISFLTSFYGEMRTQIIALQVTWQKFKIYLIDNVFGPILDAAEASLSWIPGLSGKLASAREKFAQFRRDANAELAMIQSKWTVTIIANFQARGFKSPSPGEFTGRAAGGPVRAGQTYLVGENGPEVLTMAGNGWVHNNRQMQQSSGGDTYELHVDLGAGVRQVIAFSNRDLKRRTRARSAGYA